MVLSCQLNLYARDDVITKASSIGKSFRTYISQTTIWPSEAFKDRIEKTKILFDWWIKPNFVKRPPVNIQNNISMYNTYRPMLVLLQLSQYADNILHIKTYTTALSVVAPAKQLWHGCKCSQLRGKALGHTCKACVETYAVVAHVGTFIHNKKRNSLRDVVKIQTKFKCSHYSS